MLEGRDGGGQGPSTHGHILYPLSHPKVLPGNPDLDHPVPEILPVRATAVPGLPVTGSRAQCGHEQTVHRTGALPMLEIPEGSLWGYEP